MLLLKALSHKNVRRLWFGQAFSAMGDEIYRVAFIWLSVQMIGSQTGYLSSLQLLTALCANIFWTRLVDHLHSEEAMVRLDLIRGVIVMIPVILYFLHIPSFVFLAASALLLSGLGALFDPVVMETIPKVAKEPVLLKATNGLMSTTLRLGRVLGPMIVGLLSGLIPIIHFFTLDALTFLFSAYSIKSIKIQKSTTKKLAPFVWTEFTDSLFESYRLLKTQPPVFRTLFAKCVTGGAWGLGYGLGLALLANDISPGKVATFGTMVSAYGFGNIFGVILFGNMQRHNPEKMIYNGLIWLGSFFILAAAMNSLTLILVFLALAAVGGPWNDLPFADLVQAHYPTHAISKIYRLRSIVDALFQLLMMLAAPLMFHLLPVRMVIVGCGVIMGAGGVWGRIFVRNSKTILT